MRRRRRTTPASSTSSGTPSGSSEHLTKDADPRALPQHRVLRRRGLRHRVGRPPLLRHHRRPAHAHAGRAARRHRQEPVLLRPDEQPSGGRNRRDTVIQKMLDLHVIPTHRAKQALKSDLGLHVTPTSNGCVNSRAPWFCAYLLKYLLDDPALGKTADERKHAIYGGGLTIQSTIDLRFQRAADQAVHGTVLPERPGRRRDGDGRTRHRLRPGVVAVAPDGQQPQDRADLPQLHRPDGVRRRAGLPRGFDVQALRPRAGDQAGHPAQQDDLLAGGSADLPRRLPHLHRQLPVHRDRSRSTTRRSAATRTCTPARRSRSTRSSSSWRR